MQVKFFSGVSYAALLALQAVNAIKVQEGDYADLYAQVIDTLPTSEGHADDLAELEAATTISMHPAEDELAELGSDVESHAVQSLAGGALAEIDSLHHSSGLGYA